MVKHIRSSYPRRRSQDQSTSDTTIRPNDEEHAYPSLRWPLYPKATRGPDWVSMRAATAAITLFGAVMKYPAGTTENVQFSASEHMGPHIRSITACKDIELIYHSLLSHPSHPSHPNVRGIGTRNLPASSLRPYLASFVTSTVQWNRIRIACFNSSSAPVLSATHKMLHKLKYTKQL